MIIKPSIVRIFRGFGFFEYLLILSPVVDVMVGVGKHSGIGLIAAAGPLHKILILALLVFVVVRHKSIKSWQAWVVVSSVLACAVHLLYVFLSFGAGEMGDNLNTTLRFWFFPIVVAGMLCLYSKQDVQAKWRRVLLMVASLYALALLIPTAMGINNAAYTADWIEKGGSAGLFYEANEVAIICGLLGAYFLMSYFIRKPSVVVLVVGLVTILAGLATGTKAALVYIVIAALYIVVYMITHPSRMRVNLIGAVVVMTGVIVSSQIVISNIQGSYERQVIDNSGGINDIVFNGRDKLYVTSLDKFDTEYSSFDRLFGGSSVEADGIPKKDTEMDFADILFNFGMLGLLLYAISIGLIMYNVARSRSSKPGSIEKVSFFTGMTAAAIMGHTLSSPSVGLVIAIITVMAIKQGDRGGNL